MRIKTVDRPLWLSLCKHTPSQLVSVFHWGIRRRGTLWRQEGWERVRSGFALFNSDCVCVSVHKRCLVAIWVGCEQDCQKRVYRYRMTSLEKLHLWLHWEEVYRRNRNTVADRLHTVELVLAVNLRAWIAMQLDRYCPWAVCLCRALIPRLGAANYFKSYFLNDSILKAYVFVPDAGWVSKRNFEITHRKLAN